MNSSEAIRPEHLRRPAMIAIRQSTLWQVRSHQESRRRQYDLVERARTLGWTQVIVIDDDLGRSGASSANRPGFQRLVAEVSLGRAGAVLSAVKTWPKGRPTKALRSGAGRLALTLKGGALEMAAFFCNMAFTAAPSAALRSQSNVSVSS